MKRSSGLARAADRVRSKLEARVRRALSIGLAGGTRSRLVAAFVFVGIQVRSSSRPRVFNHPTPEKSRLDSNSQQSKSGVLIDSG